MSCSVCGTISDVETANIGRDQHFTAPITSLKRHGFAGCDDLWECPECEAVFLWRDESQQSGSGNNDEEVLRRLPAGEAALVRTFLHRGDRPAVEVAADAPQLRDLSEAVRAMVLSHVLGKDRELAACLVPRFLDFDPPRSKARNDTWAIDFVAGYVSSVDAKLVEAELARRPDAPGLDELRARCKRVLCTICRAVPSISTVVARRDAPPAPLDRLLRFDATDELDAWECPECRSLFMWKKTDGEEGRLSRIADYAAGPLYACLHRKGDLPSYDLEMVMASDRDASLKIVVGHGMKRDRELVRQLIPRIRAKIARRFGGQSDWMDEVVRRFAETEPDTE